MSDSAFGALALFIFLVPSSLSCHLGYNIIGIHVQRTDQYEITCAQRALPICPRVCSWTNQTCEEYATQRHWNKKGMIVTNITYSYPLEASGYPRKDTGGGRIKSLHRRCCLADNIDATRCKSIMWNVDQTKGTFDVLASAETTLKCPTKNAYIRDIQQRAGIQRSYSVEVCCLRYPKDHSARVVCLAPKNGASLSGAQAAVATSTATALGVSLPVALVIGNPLLFFDCEPHVEKRIMDYSFFCNSAQVVYGMSEAECCKVCVQKKFEVCGYLSAADATKASGAPSQRFCATCRGLTAINPFPPGIHSVLIYPK